MYLLRDTPPQLAPPGGPHIGIGLHQAPTSIPSWSISSWKGSLTWNWAHHPGVSHLFGNPKVQTQGEPQGTTVQSRGSIIGHTSLEMRLWLSSHPTEVEPGWRQLSWRSGSTSFKFWHQFSLWTPKPNEKFSLAFCILLYSWHNCHLPILGHLQTSVAVQSLEPLKWLTIAGRQTHIHPCLTDTWWQNWFFLVLFGHQNEWLFWTSTNIGIPNGGDPFPPAHVSMSSCKDPAESTSGRKVIPSCRMPELRKKQLAAWTNCAMGDRASRKNGRPVMFQRRWWKKRAGMLASTNSSKGKGAVEALTYQGNIPGMGFSDGKVM